MVSSNMYKLVKYNWNVILSTTCNHILMRQGLQLELQEMTCFLLEVEDVGSVKTILTQS